ncbi:MAG: glucose-1-phosphate adenylyltransferase, partial [Candidatus Eisenbacteria bacterium]|nr:glucose-1-phosphate adenylyltransferase [Candidatus Eisenbacteria bacterium]
PKETECTLASMGVYIFRRDTLIKLLQEDRENPDSSHDFGRDIFPRLIALTDVGAHPYEGYWQDIGTLQAFYEDNLKLLDPVHSRHLNQRDWPIRTPSVDAPPVRIQGKTTTKHSLIANGAVVRGYVENSILFPGVTVEPGAVVRDSILMNDVHVGSDAHVHKAIMDKRVRVGARSTVGAEGDGPANRKVPDLLYSGITVMGKDTSVGDEAHIGRNVVLGGRQTVDHGGEVSDGSYVTE